MAEFLENRHISNLVNVNVNVVNVNVISRTSLIRNRVSRRVFHVSKIAHGVSSIYFKRPKPISFPS